MPIINEDKKVLWSFFMDRGEKTIEKRETPHGYEDTAVYAKPIVKGDIVTLSDIGDGYVKKASAEDVIVGVVSKIPKPKIYEDEVECVVELYGRLYRPPLKPTNAVIKPADELKVTVSGVDKGTGNNMYSLEGALASDDKEEIEVFLALAGEVQKVS